MIVGREREGRQRESETHLKVIRVMVMRYILLLPGLMQ